MAYARQHVRISGRYKANRNGRNGKTKNSRTVKTAYRKKK